MEPDHDKNSLNDSASDAARREFRAALSRARAAGLDWREIMRVLAEHSPDEASEERPRPTDWPPRAGG